ncbi:AAA family ATPase [Sphingomonas sp. HF-S3]|uniref:AAA family ATPase n=1 Tax=Sphingomonas rustica TaxID=3103142 RepID=A0ABV0B5P2_9SPHN
MNEFTIVRSVLLRATRDVAGKSALAKAILAWAEPHFGWLTGSKEKTGFRALIRSVEQQDRATDPVELPLRQAATLARVLGLAPDAELLLALCVAADRCPRATRLVQVLRDNGVDVPSLLAEVAGTELHALRRSPIFRLGLIRLVVNRAGQVEIDIAWTLDRLLDRPDDSEEALIEIVVGLRQRAQLEPSDFVGHEDRIGLLRRLLAGALASRAPGINILIHGPPGTGKTELARTLGQAAGADLFSVGEADEDGDEPTRCDRVAALQLAHRVVAGRGDTVLLFDEMEDLIGDTQRAQGGDWFSRREGSKLFINRMLETNAVPVIWTTNAIGNVDPAILRRMSYVFELGLPGRKAGQRMLSRIEQDEGVVLDAAVAGLVAAAPEAATVLRVAARAGKLAGEGGDTAAFAGSLSRALRGGARVLEGLSTVDLDLFEGDLPLAPLFDRITGPDAPCDVSLLLTGPPGTGKTALAGHLAVALDRPLIVKRASDLLSKWVGGTEANIAGAFEEALRDEAVLFFDEADSLLYDRSTASRSWEVSQVNEMLTWLDRHPLPFVAASNFAGRLDPAALRRFVFKLDLQPLGPMRSAMAFERFFGVAAPVELCEIAGLTPGDFAVVRRQLRFVEPPCAAAIVDRLRAEVAAKPGASGRLGF